MSSALNGASFLLDNFDEKRATTVFIHMIWRREPGQPAPMELIPGAIEVAQKKAGRQGLELAAQPKYTEFREVRLEPGMGIRTLQQGEAGDYFMLTMEFDVLGRVHGH